MHPHKDLQIKAVMLKRVMMLPPIHCDAEESYDAVMLEAAWSCNIGGARSRLELCFCDARKPIAH